MWRSLVTVICFFTVVYGIANEDEVSLSVRVDPGKTECFFQNVVNKNYGSMEVSYMVLKGGDLDINFFIRNPISEVIAQNTQEQSSRHSIELNDERSFGTYIFCFDNNYSNIPKVVALHVYLLDKEGNFLSDLALLDAANAANIEARLEFFEASTSRMKSNLKRIESEQETMQHVETIDRTIAETNFENINFWGIVNTAVMLFAGLIQVFLIRSILSEDSKIGKILRRAGKYD